MRAAMACVEVLTIECQTCGREDELRRPNLSDPRVADRLRACVGCGAEARQEGSRVVAGPEWYWWAVCS